MTNKQKLIEELIPKVMPELIKSLSYNGSLHLGTDVLPETAKEPEPTTPYEETSPDFWTMLWLSRIVSRIIVERDAAIQLEQLKLLEDFAVDPETQEDDNA